MVGAADSIKTTGVGASDAGSLPQVDRGIPNLGAKKSDGTEAKVVTQNSPGNGVADQYLSVAGTAATANQAVAPLAPGQASATSSRVVPIKHNTIESVGGKTYGIKVKNFLGLKDLDPKDTLVTGHLVNSTHLKDWEPIIGKNGVYRNLFKPGVSERQRSEEILKVIALLTGSIEATLQNRTGFSPIEENAVALINNPAAFGALALPHEAVVAAAIKWLHGEKLSSAEMDQLVAVVAPQMKEKADEIIGSIAKAGKAPESKRDASGVVGFFVANGQKIIDASEQALDSGKRVMAEIGNQATSELAKDFIARQQGDFIKAYQGTGDSTPLQYVHFAASNLMSKKAAATAAQRLPNPAPVGTALPTREAASPQVPARPASVAPPVDGKAANPRKSVPTSQTALRTQAAPVQTIAKNVAAAPQAEPKIKAPPVAVALAADPVVEIPSSRTQPDAAPVISSSAQVVTIAEAPAPVSVQTVKVGEHAFSKVAMLLGVAEETLATESNGQPVNSRRLSIRELAEKKKRITEKGDWLTGSSWEKQLFADLADAGIVVPSLAELYSEPKEKIEPIASDAFSTSGLSALQLAVAERRAAKAEAKQAQAEIDRTKATAKRQGQAQVELERDLADVQDDAQKERLTDASDDERREAKHAEATPDQASRNTTSIRRG